MSFRLAACALVVAAAASPTPGHGRDRHVLWTVQGQVNTVYLLGSIHALRPGDIVLPEAAEQAYADAEQLVMEIDLDDPAESDPAALLTQMQRVALLPEGQSLRQVLGDDYATIDADVGRSGLDLDLLDRFAPWFVATSVLQLELARRGFSPELGIEQVLATRAGRDGKPIRGLETTAGQLALLADLPLPVQKRFLEMTLEESSRLDEELGELVRLWRAGDTAGLASLLGDEYQEFPDLYRTLTVDRNRAWADELVGLLDDRDDYLVVVGALHLVGRESVVELLERRGFEVEQQ